ncbi:uncharacterized protein TRIADDRAFT_58760 [Trichoplax adhaerens]|uniref:Uncharacterized protein n=1 Tax=Trichoplax adhaerens TaxID=10228 RepID=B3S3K9_TRIAD|nr:predicted protein [Trichoplax adhaerens]EDV22814.1 predicted protein [Trichoplax adhaerens]|eukprot:XP_002114680.1 predicted protein [Trichoplax adhaerens]
MASSSLKSHIIYACGIENQFVEDFKKVVIQLAPNIQIGSFTNYVCSKKRNWNFVELRFSSEKDGVQLKVQLTGLKIKESKLPLRLFWPVEMDNSKRKQLNYDVSKQLAQLGRKTYGCYYDRNIEEKQTRGDKLFGSPSRQRKKWGLQLTGYRVSFRRFLPEIPPCPD